MGRVRVPPLLRAPAHRPPGGCGPRSRDLLSPRPGPSWVRGRLCCGSASGPPRRGRSSGAGRAVTRRPGGRPRPSPGAREAASGRAETAASAGSRGRRALRTRPGRKGGAQACARGFSVLRGARDRAPDAGREGRRPPGTGTRVRKCCPRGAVAASPPHPIPPARRGCRQGRRLGGKRNSPLAQAKATRVCAPAGRGRQGGTSSTFTVGLVSKSKLLKREKPPGTHGHPGAQALC